MKNKLDSFNKNKIKCTRCKDFFDKHSNLTLTCRLCQDCYEEWVKRSNKLGSDWMKSEGVFSNDDPYLVDNELDKLWIDFLNEQ